MRERAVQSSAEEATWAGMWGTLAHHSDACELRLNVTHREGQPQHIGSR